MGPIPTEYDPGHASTSLAESARRKSARDDLGTPPHPACQRESGGRGRIAADVVSTSNTSLCVWYLTRVYVLLESLA